MMPIGALMVEHRWIERVIEDVRLRLGEQSSRSPIDSGYVNKVIDFLRIYAERCHYGKEEDILFRDLAEKNLEPPLRDMMGQLVADHAWARAATGRLDAANASLAAGHRASLEEVRRLLGDLAAFYPEHMQREDKVFFRPAMTHLSEDEQAGMLEAFMKFDAALIHEKYRQVVHDLERER